MQAADAPVLRGRSVREAVGYGSLLLVVGAVAALLAADLAGRRAEIVREAEASATAQSQLMARSFGTTLIATDYVLIDLMDRLTTEMLSVTDAATGARLHELLVRKASTLPGLTGLGVYGSDCVFRHALDASVIGFRSNQSFCRDPSERVGDEMRVQYVPSAKSADRRPALLISRNRADASGALLGGVVGVISLESAQRWIEQFAARPSDVMVMMDTGATVVARLPQAPGVIGQTVPLPESRSIPVNAWESGAFTAPWPLDGTVRICAVSRIERVPLAVVVGFGRDAALHEWRRRVWQLVPTFFLLAAMAFTLLHAYLASVRRRADLERALAELRAATEHVKVLSGLLPICASCKKIRDDGGYWNQIELYIRDHSEAEFSHGICPDCVRKLYPDIADELEREQVSEGDASATSTRRE